MLFRSKADKYSAAPTFLGLMKRPAPAFSRPPACGLVLLRQGLPYQENHLASQKENRPKPLGSGRITNPRYHLISRLPCGSRALTGASTPFPDNGGTTVTAYFSFSRAAQGRLLRRLPGSLHQPLPLFASARRVLLPILAVSDMRDIIVYPPGIVKRGAGFPSSTE